MCIIAIKQAGTPVDWSILDACDLNNPDGGGYAFTTEAGVIIRKGFFHLDEMQAQLESETIDTTAKTIMFHFRIATHGKVAPSTCHPFPISSDVGELTQTDFLASSAVAHNGIIPNMPDDRKLSDTMLFIRDFMAPLEDKIMDEAVINLIALSARSKLAIMTEDDQLILIGKFIDTYDGWLFSNTSYKPYYSSKIKGSTNTFLDEQWKGYLDALDLDTGYEDTLAYCDACSTEFETKDLADIPDKLGDANWTVCPRCEADFGDLDEDWNDIKMHEEVKNG
jgi:hypothetical protein